MEASGQFHAQAALPPCKEPRYPSTRILDGPQSRSRRDEEINLCHYYLNQAPIEPVLWLNKCVRTCESVCLLPHAFQWAMFWETPVYSSAISLAMYQERALVSSLSALTMPVICSATCLQDLAGIPAFAGWCGRRTVARSWQFYV